MKGQSVAIVGGSAGIGFALAKILREAGAEVVIGARDPGRLEQAARELGVRHHVVNSMDAVSVSEFFDFTGPVDHLATPGSSVRVGPLKTGDWGDLEFTMQNKFLGQALCAREAEVRGSITFFSGVLAVRPGPWPMLGAVNAAVETMARGLSIELSPVRVNAVSPGLTRDTEAFQKMPPDEQEKMFEAASARLPVGRVGTPDDSARAAFFLMQNPFVTGTVFYIDGGASAI